MVVRIKGIRKVGEDSYKSDNDDFKAKWSMYKKIEDYIDLLNKRKMRVVDTSTKNDKTQ